MFDWLDGGDLAGMSAALALWLYVSVACMVVLTWRYLGRFANWRAMSDRSFSDAMLHVGLLGFFAYASFQRSIATYSFAVAEWRLSPITLTAAPPLLTWGLFFVACIMWWMCFEIFGPPRNRKWWVAFIVCGFALGYAISWVY